MLHHWGTQGTSLLTLLIHPSETSQLIFPSLSLAPLRFLLSFILLLYTFLSSASSPLYRTDATGNSAWTTSPFSSQAGRNPSYAPSGWGGDGLKNRVFFAFIFVEMVSWLWVWVTLREERRDILQRKAVRRGRTASESYYS